MTTRSPEWLDAKGAGATRIWAMTNRERVARLARAEDDAGRRPVAGRVLVVDQSFVFDPIVMRLALDRPDTHFTHNGVLVLGQMQRDAAAAPAATVIDLATGPTVYNAALRKLERPFAILLTEHSRREAERALYGASYKGVTDLLTKYLWPELALVLTRVAARIGMTPNMVTAIGALLCVAATFAFAAGQYWLGTAMGLVFMVLDTVDGKLARCTVTSSYWGNIFDHGIDLVHPPFWWWFWAIGLAHRGLALSGEVFAWTMIAIIGGYVVQRGIEGAFIRRFDGIHIHVWERIDSRFRLITARRNPNMVILFASLLLARPDWGIVAVAVWTVISLAFHGMRLAQAIMREKRGQAITTWLAKG